MSLPTPIRRKLMQMLLLTTGVVLLFTCSAFFTYELVTFRQTLVRQLDTLAKAIASNSTAALAFDNPDDARAALAAFKADPHIVAAALYDETRRAVRFLSAVRRNSVTGDCTGERLPVRGRARHRFRARDGRQSASGHAVREVGPEGRPATLRSVRSHHRDRDRTGDAACLPGVPLAAIADLATHSCPGRDGQSGVRSARLYRARRVRRYARDRRAHGCLQSHAHADPGIRGAPACADVSPEPAAADHWSDRRAAGPAEHLPGRVEQRGGEPADRLRLRLPVRRRGGNAHREHRRRGQPEPVSAPRSRRASRRSHRSERLVALHAGTAGLRA